MTDAPDSLPQPLTREAAFAVATDAAVVSRTIGAAFRDLPPLPEWVEAAASPARFSRHHFADNAGFALPFVPEAFVWSPVAIEVPVVPHPARTGHYRRGVKKYVHALERGEALPPVAFVWTRGLWSLLDGNHRYEAHSLAGRDSIGAVFAFPK